MSMRHFAMALALALGGCAAGPEAEPDLPVPPPLPPSPPPAARTMPVAPGAPPALVDQYDAALSASVTIVANKPASADRVAELRRLNHTAEVAMAMLERAKRGEGYQRRLDAARSAVAALHDFLKTLPP